MIPANLTTDYTCDENGCPDPNGEYIKVTMTHTTRDSEWSFLVRRSEFEQLMEAAA